MLRTIPLSHNKPIKEMRMLEKTSASQPRLYVRITWGWGAVKNNCQPGTTLAQFKKKTLSMGPDADIYIFKSPAISKDNQG